MNVSQEVAETTALKALAWLVNNEEVCSVFFGSTGASIDDLRARAAEPDFLGSVLEFITMDDAWVVEFCDNNALAYEVPMMAAAALLGTARTHWT